MISEKNKLGPLSKNSLNNTKCACVAQGQLIKWKTSQSASDSSNMKRPKDKMNEIIGQMGRWQMQNIAIVFLIGIPGLAHIYSSAFVAAKTDFGCINDGGNLTWKKCDCPSGYAFDQSFWESTIIMQWELVCENKYLATLAKMIFFGGFAAGTFSAGIISDNYGRKPAIVLMAQMLFGCGILAATMPTYISFVFVWFFTGVAAIGVYTVCFVWAMESVSGRWKTFVGMGMNYAWPVGRLTVPIVAYITRDWKAILQILSAMHIITPILMNFVPESPRWLLATNRKSKMLEARDVLEKAAKINGVYMDGQTDAQLDELVEPKSTEEMQAESQSRLGFLDLFRYPVLRTRSLVMFFNWFTNSFILYGLALNWQSLTGDLFTNFVIGAALDFPAKTLAMFMLIKAGRRWPYIICIGLGGVAFSCMIFFERDVYPNNWPIVACAMVGNLFVSTTFAIIWLYTPELFPTNIRNTGLGACSLVARIGGVLANTVGNLAEININIPTILFGSTALISAFLTLLLPETAGKPLPNTVEDCLMYDSKSRGMRQEEDEEKEDNA